MTEKPTLPPLFNTARKPPLPRVFNRKDWHARAYRAHYRLDPAKVAGIALHWPAITKPLGNPARVMSALRSWQDYHMDSRGWSDIAYQVAVDQQGNRYRLRGLRFRSGANGDQEVNETYGAVLLVLAEGEQPTRAMITGVQQLVENHRERFPRSRRIVGHGEIRPEPTACPGPAVQRLIDLGEFGPNPKGPR